MNRFIEYSNEPSVLPEILNVKKYDGFRDIIHNLSFGKKNLFEEDPIGMGSSFEPYFVNKAFSMYIDTCLYSQDMNLASSLPKNMQWDYYFFSLKKTKRYGGWCAKKKISDNIKMVSNYFNVNYQRSEEYLEFLSDDELKRIESELDKGGIIKKGQKNVREML